MKILLADDDTDDRWFFQDFLKHRTDVAFFPSVTDGVEVLEYLNSVEADSDFPHVIILDQNMPKLSGKETLCELKANPRYSEIAIVIYSTYTDQKLIDDCRLLGALTVQPKPVSLEGYNEMIDAILKAYAENVFN
ncbi:response regulator [Dyadobacter psychrotolerans]|uniref:Response regulator n=1 Tax=Dyadobacter psychrotolerans TaxID=2541721 RepID=A0A4R5DN17_9BACT|nr:response regulator [Dyadobacter psychrotolerans]TDE12093.1 response regulator [Dyadobacter psychrotolerans]